MERRSITNDCSQFCTHPNPLSFFVFSLVYIPKKDIYFISESEDDICFKHKKGMVDHASIKPAKKSKSMSIHHGFRDKKKKIITLIAGVYVQLIIFSLCSIVYDLYSRHSTWLATFILWNVLMVFSNILPFIKLDGYWILSNIVEIPNLYEKSLKLALGRGEEVLFDEREIRKKKFIKVFGILNIVSRLLIIQN